MTTGLPRHMRSPGEDGYRTPTIEDAAHDLGIHNFNTIGFFHPRGTKVRQAHTSALQALSNPDFRGDELDTNESADHGISCSRRRYPHSAVVHLSWKKRLRHFTWAYFTLTMATGGIANVLYSIPFRFPGLETIGIVVFLLNIALYLTIWGLLLARFYFYPYTFRASFLHPTESLFVPASVVSFGTILINISQYGPDHTGQWLANAVGILFWIDAALAVSFSAGIYLLLWSTQTFTIGTMTPIWIFPLYSCLIVGPHAGVLSAKLEPYRALPIIIGGTTIQGIGFLVALMVYSAFIYRLMTQKLPKEHMRPGMFVSVGPSAFTVAGIVDMASQAKRVFPESFMGNGPLAADIVKVVASFASLWLWGLALFFFFIASFAHWSAIGPRRMVFSMTWFSFVFPNTALITATFAIGNTFSCRPILILGTAMVIPLILMYFFVCAMMIRAIRLRHILWPQRGEDKDEGGFEINQIKPETPGVRTPEEA